MKPWTESKTVRALAIWGAANILMQLVPMLTAHRLDWWVLGATAATTIAGILFRLAGDDVQAPPMLGMLNRKTD